MPMIRVRHAALMTQAEMDQEQRQWDQERLEELSRELRSVEYDIERLEKRRQWLREDVAKLTAEGE